jgi:hypothetical protein
MCDLEAICSQNDLKHAVEVAEQLLRKEMVGKRMQVLWGLSFFVCVCVCVFFLSENKIALSAVFLCSSWRTSSLLVGATKTLR